MTATETIKVAADAGVQVFGPGRPAAARQAIYALSIAREARAADPWDYYGTHARLVAATEIRAAYHEYGDSFTSH